MKNLNPNRINPTETAAYVCGINKHFTNSQVCGIEPVRGIETPAHAELVCLGLVYSYGGEVSQGWIEDAKRFLVVIKQVCESGLLPQEIYLSFVESVVEKIYSARHEDDARIDDLQKRGYEILAKYYLAPADWGVWDNASKVPPEWQALISEYDETLNDIRRAAVEEISDPDLVPLYEQGGWDDFAGSKGVNCVAKSFFSGKETRY